jgi:2-polyprenyl-6-methoxyphenol hydroxylase-like FAD-dependent oxidoreductase
MDKGHILTRYIGCRITVFSRDAALMNHDCDATRSDSGSPMMIRRGDDYRIVGIHVGTAMRGGKAIGVAISGAHLNALIEKRYFFQYFDHVPAGRDCRPAAVRYHFAKQEEPCGEGASMAERYHVAIVGGGPVGVALAVNLALRGISCVVLERYESLQNIPKGQNLLQRSVEHFYFWDLADELRDARVMPKDFPMTGIVAYGSLDNEYWYAPPLRELLNPYYFFENERMPQYRMEAVLRKKAASLPNIDLRLGWAAESVTQDADTVRITARKGDGGPVEEIEADYAVGCDGANSRVRDQIGITRSGADFDQLMVLTVFRSKELTEKLNARFPPRSTYRVMHKDINGYWQFFGRIDVEEGFFFHAPVPRDTTRETFDFHGLMQQIAGFDFACEFDHVGFWDLRVSVADVYQIGRVFIAGDAAHSHPPYGGYGLNNGLEDSVNLGWKLAARLKGWGTDALLASYGAERHPIFRETGDDFISARIQGDADFFNRHNPEKDEADFEEAWKGHAKAAAPRVLNYEPHYESSPVVDGPPGAKSSAHGDHLFKARPGHHLPPQPLSDGRNVYEALGRDFTLLAFGVDDEAVAAIADAAAARGVPLTVIKDSYEDGRTAYEAKMMLVRPDQFVAWRGDAPPADPAALIAKVVGAG